jgi:hypothetical protein
MPSGPHTDAPLNVSGAAVATCSACAHPWGEHDQIAARYCAATIVGHHERGCVCTARPDTGTGRTTG